MYKRIEGRAGGGGGGAASDLGLETCKLYVFSPRCLPERVSMDEKLLLHCKLYGSSPVR